MTYRQLGNCKYSFDVPPPIEKPCRISIDLEDKEIMNIKSPEVWGQAFWFINHLGSVNAPEIIPEDRREKYWSFIDGLPEMLACGKCQIHARNFVENNRQYKDIICSSRNNLVKFFVDFHNDVNRRTGKPELSLDDIYQMFSGPVRLRHFRYS